MRQIAPALAALLVLVIMNAPSMAANIQLMPVASGLSRPVFVTHAHDGSNRLFILEQTGLMKVLQPGATTPTVFLDLTGKVLYGGERGLLGLAFHPQYPSNPRFYVDYTRAGDGATVIAEYQVSGNPNVAATNEVVLLTIPQPYANHNGGMLSFGPDGYLYISKGDGGSANDPDNRGQNIDDLLGKILRIDVDHPNGAIPYSSPSTNPFYGATAGADEIFAYGFRNPWRFSFDRALGTLYVADVGQAQREEVDIVTLGLNYGWRVWEGTYCSGFTPDPMCTGSGYTPPVIEYPHTLSRCSITGGYVYRGTAANLPVGSYVFGDYCTGEIFLVENSTMSVLLDTTLSISSFGEDEAGEIYVVNLNGTISRIVAAPPPTCTYTINPTSANFGTAGGTGTVAVQAPAGCAWTAVSNNSWIMVTGGSSGYGNGTVTYSIGPYTQKKKFQDGTMTIAKQTFKVRQSR